jgi:hypothetical protein
MHWNNWAGFDWGYHHPWTFGFYTVDEDGQVYKRESLIGRLDLPEQINAKVRAAGIDPSKIVIYGSPDAWRTRQNSKGHIKGEFLGPTIAEQLQHLGWRLNPAADARVAGLNNIRRYTYIDPLRPKTRPRFLWMETVGNKACLAQMAKMPLDPKNPEDALKIDADAAGRGGDDYYDENRYALMARPLASVPERTVASKQPHRAWALKVEDGKVVKPPHAPRNVEELAAWAEERASKQRLPHREITPRRSYR